MMDLKHLTAQELPESEYHGDKYADYLSGSELWAYIDSCPAEYVYGEKKETQSMITGSAVHSEVLEMATFDDLYYRGFEPDENTLTSDAAVKAQLKALGIAGHSSKFGQELWDMLLNAEPDSIIEKNEIRKMEEASPDRTMLPFAQYDMAKAMRKQLMEYPEYARYINEGICESSIIGECELFGQKIMVKTRPDIILDHEIVNYKTANSAKPRKLIRSAYDNGYYLKEVFNALVYEQFTGVFPTIKILAQSKKAPYVCTGFTMTQDMIDIGMAQLEKAFLLWSECKEAGVVIDFAQGQWLDDLEVEPWMFNV